jgi:predicted Fe-Mo cluster-binding NifX family protein
MKAMSVAVTSMEDHLESAVSNARGRTRFILVVDAQGRLQEVIPCSDREAVWGVGLSLAHLFVNRGVRAFLTPFCGPCCFETLRLVGVQIVTGIQGSVSQVLADYRSGNLEQAREPNIDWDAMAEDHEMDALMGRLRQHPGWSDVEKMEPE